MLSNEVHKRCCPLVTIAVTDEMRESIVKPSSFHARPIGGLLVPIGKSQAAMLGLVATLTNDATSAAVDSKYGSAAAKNFEADLELTP
jgi:hypothetical protein